ncbi:hypothetical protein ABPG75_012020 [Micractinium tetrahymenae]
MPPLLAPLSSATIADLPDDLLALIFSCLEEQSCSYFVGAVEVSARPVEDVRRRWQRIARSLGRSRLWLNCEYLARAVFAESSRAAADAAAAEGENEPEEGEGPHSSGDGSDPEDDAQESDADRLARLLRSLGKVDKIELCKLPAQPPQGLLSCIASMLPLASRSMPSLERIHLDVEGVPADLAAAVVGLPCLERIHLRMWNLPAADSSIWASLRSLGPRLEHGCRAPAPWRCRGLTCLEVHNGTVFPGIPPGFDPASLAELQVLHTGFSDLGWEHGRFPPVLCGLPKLQSMRLSGRKVGGTPLHLPPQLSRLSTLECLSIDYALLDSPSCAALFGLPGLTRLVLQMSRAAAVPAGPCWRCLQELDVSGTLFEGPEGPEQQLLLPPSATASTELSQLTISFDAAALDEEWSGIQETLEALTGLQRLHASFGPFAGSSRPKEDPAAARLLGGLLCSVRWEHMLLSKHLGHEFLRLSRA